ncbi:hypothetical protein PCE1_000431 [Barthelona sp. PCE]
MFVPSLNTNYDKKKDISEKHLYEQVIRDSWTIFEDELIIGTQMGQDKKSWRQVVSMYGHRRKRNPSNFPRSEVTPDVLYNRYLALTSLNIYKSRVDLLERWFTTTTSKTSDNGQKESEAEAPDTNGQKVKITLEGYGFPTKTFVTSLGPLAEQSEYLARQTEGYAFAGVKQVQHVVLSDMTAEYEGSRTYNHFEYSNFMRFLQCCMNPGIHLKERELTRQLHDLENTFELHKEAIVGTFRKAMSHRFDYADSLRVQMLSEVNGELDRKFEDEIRLIRTKYQMLKEKKNGEINGLWKNITNGVEAFFNNQFERIEEITEKSRHRESERLETELDKLKYEVNQVFRNSAVKVLLLAEDLQAFDIKRSAINEIVKHFDTYIESEPLRENTILSDQTYRAILSQLSVYYLRKLLEVDKPSIRRDLVRIELNVRRKAASTQYLKMTNAQLRNLLVHDENEFRDLVESEITRRSKANPDLAIVVAYESMKDAVEITGLSAIIRKPFQISYVRLSQPITQHISAKSFFTISIDGAALQDRVIVGVGVDFAREDVENTVVGLQKTENDEYGMMIMNDGRMHANGKSYETNVVFGVGDVVGVGIDVDGKNVIFMVNGEMVRIAATEQDYIPFSASTFEIYPTIMMPLPI